MKAAVVLLVAACGGKAPPPVTSARAEPAAPAVPASSPKLLFANSVSIRRPTLDLSAILPDPMPEARWPLAASTHPEMEPHFAIAEALAQPGVTWIDLCALGAQNRRMPGRQDLITYLHGWCNALRHDPAAAIDDLERLRTSMIPDMKESVAIDIADILVDAGTADDAERLLAGAHIVDSEVLDLLSAGFYEVGRRADAFDLNERALEADASSPLARRCHRMVKRVVLGAEDKRRDNFKPLVTLAVRANDSTCIDLIDELGCWLNPADGCTGYIAGRGLDPGYRGLLSAYFRWPPIADADEWWTIADGARGALDFSGADAMTVASLVAVLATSHCSPQWLARIAEAAKQVADHRHDAALDERLQQLLAIDHARCVAAAR